MAEATAIEWCDATWSPWEGCTKISPACDHCYAAARNGRFSAGANWGPSAPRRLTADWLRPRHWNARAAKEGRTFKVFPSLCDPFDNEVDPAWRLRFFKLIADTPHLTWLLLTKRIGNAHAMLREVAKSCGGGEQPIDNVWLGATVVNQAEADRDIPKLLAVPARVRFLSIEPMLGPITLPAMRCDHGSLPGPGGAGGVTCTDCNGLGERGASGCRRIDWVICGGESGPGARPMHPDWARSLRDQCKAAGVAFFIKQMGGVRDKRGALMDLPEDLRAREFP